MGVDIKKEYGNLWVGRDLNGKIPSSWSAGRNAKRALADHDMGVGSRFLEIAQQWRLADTIFRNNESRNCLYQKLCP